MIDTAGIRKRVRFTKTLVFSAAGHVRHKRSDIVCLVLDAETGSGTRQEGSLLSMRQVRYGHSGQ